MAKLEIQRVDQEIRAAYFLAREGNWAGARGILRNIRASFDAAGIQSGYILWLGAVAADRLGLISEATELIDRACERDPACPQFLNSRRIIYGRLEAADESPVAALSGDP